MEPFTIHRPTGVPKLVFDSPHSGRFYPDDFRSNATRVELRRGEDAYVDELLAGTPTLGVVLLAANYPRCYIDVNRAVTDIDAAMLAEPWPEPLHPTEKSARGLGLIRRYVVPGVEAQAGPLTVAEVRQRIDSVYAPYHEALDALIHEVLVARDRVLHVNWHSMKSVGNAMTPDGEGAKRPDFVVSDGRGRTAAPAVTAAVVDALRGMGFQVSVNDPYTGGTIVKRLGAPDRGVHSVQIEINRALYLDEKAVEKREGFGGLTQRLEQLTRNLTAL